MLPGAIDTPMLWDNPNVKSGVEKINPSRRGQARRRGRRHRLPWPPTIGIRAGRGAAGRRRPARPLVGYK
ncbi:MAG: hypothetical protein WKG07_49610 [Hymenobacter sp.]